MRDRLTFTILILASVVFGSANSRAQERPDFSGTWSLPPDAPLARNGRPAPAPGFGPTINILQDARRVTIARLMGGTTVHVVHPLDGSETRSRTPGRLCQGDSESVWTASWQGSDILTTLVGALQAGASAATKMDVKTVFRLQGPETMAVEITLRNPGTTAPQTQTTIYMKNGPPAAIPEPDVAPLQAGISQVGWLGGTWVGTSGTTMVEERWTPAAGGSMLAISRTIRDGVLNGFEFLCVVERNGGLTYQAMPNGRQPATDFSLTAMGPNSLTFENPAHDFPKMIRYRLGPDGTLEAVVSGSEQQKLLTFRFRKQNPQ